MQSLLLGFFIFTHSAYITDSLDVQEDIINFINPNRASYSQLADIPFLSDREIMLIMRERNVKPFTSIEDLSERIGLLPFETSYLKDVFYFRRHYHFIFNTEYDRSFYYRISMSQNNKPVFSIWKKQNRTYFMNAVHTSFASFYQGYIRPAFLGDLTEPSSVIRRKDALLRDSVYHIGAVLKNATFFYGNSGCILRFHTMNIGVILMGSDYKNLPFKTVFLRKNFLFLELGENVNRAIFLLSFKQYEKKSRIYADVYSKILGDSTRLTGSHVYARYRITTTTSLKVSSAYRYSDHSSMRLGLTLHVSMPKNRIFSNIGLKKSYYNPARIYMSIGKWGKNYMYVSIVKSLTTGGYFLRYSTRIHGFHIKYALSSGSESFFVLDNGINESVFAESSEKLDIGYSVYFKGVGFKINYTANNKNNLSLYLSGRISY